MKKPVLISIALILFSMNAFAKPEVLLNCGTSLGPDQEVKVLSEDGVLYLKELTTSGRFVKRVLSQEEWDSKKLILREEPGVVSTFTLEESGYWLMVSEGFRSRQVTYGQCD
ncbi:MAG: hypothetical protein V4692_12985 [Bdellovibrionota bacterium]